jgi:hypothetical protein
MSRVGNDDAARPRGEHGGARLSSQLSALGPLSQQEGRPAPRRLEQTLLPVAFPGQTALAHLHAGAQQTLPQRGRARVTRPSSQAPQNSTETGMQLTAVFAGHSLEAQRCDLLRDESEREQDARLAEQQHGHVREPPSVSQVWKYHAAPSAATAIDTGRNTRSGANIVAMRRMIRKKRLPSATRRMWLLPRRGRTTNGWNPTDQPPRSIDIVIVVG